MSFEKLPKGEIVGVLEAFGVEVPENANKAEMLAALAEEGVTFEQYQMFSQAEVVTENIEPLEDTAIVAKTTRRAKKPDDVLLKMTRQNPYFEVYGKVFTKEHPFVICTEDEAQLIIDAEEGFAIATPREAAQYYS